MPDADQHLLNALRLMVIALTLESAQAWAVVIGSIGAVIVSAISAMYAKKAGTNSGQAKDAAVVAAGAATAMADKAQTADLKLDQIHEKADIAIAQNEKIGADTNGNLSKMQQQLTEERAYRDALKEQIVALTAMLTAKQVASSQAARHVRKEDLDRTNEKKKSGDGGGD